MTFVRYSCCLREVVEVGVDMEFEEQQEISQRQYILHGKLETCNNDCTSRPCSQFLILKGTH
jgi:hypothetical protein